MEALLLLGCFLSIPLIYYGSQTPLPPPPAAPAKASESSNAELSKQASERRKKVLSHLSEEEKELVHEYLHEMRHPSKKDDNRFLKAVDFIVVTLLLCFIGAAAYLIASNQMPGLPKLKLDL
mmetsp:Transcript_18480/g.33291  ORF Transcript_18480/g.33291 Transcript_18480/m.33291 type:complete len:122 (+) Transcript_18480:579-944(+)